MLEDADGTRRRDAPDAEIRADLVAHRRAVMPALLRKPEFCAVCHKSAIVPELNGRKWFRTFSVYDEWQQSAFAQETAQPLAQREYRSCRDCHMPKQAATGYASHRWPGGNTAIPAHYGWPRQLQATKEFLQDNAVTVDIFAVSAPDGPPAQAFTASNAPVIPPGRAVAVDVVVANRGVGHAFPAELRDMFEAGLEFEARDAAGRVLYHSGAVRPDGTLDWNAHAYRAVPLDDQGRPVTRHDIWRTRVGGFDRFIPAGRSDLGRFAFTVPADAQTPLKLTARLNYRRFNARYIEWVRRSEKDVAASPVTQMSEATVTAPLGVTTNDKHAVSPDSAKTGQAAPSPELYRRWRSYGVALFDQQQYEAAAQAFGQARLFAPPATPEEAAVCVDLALSYLRLERAGPSQQILAQAGECLRRALEITPNAARPLYYRALLHIKQFKYTEALATLESLARSNPQDRQVWTQLAALYLLQRRDREAQTAYEHILTIDPDDTEAHFKLSGLYWRFGLTEAAKLEQSKYQARHNDTVGETLRRDFLRSRPELYETWPWREFGDNPFGTTP